LSDIAIVSAENGKFRRKSSDTSLIEIACEPCIGIFKKSPELKNQIDCVLLSTTSDIQYSATILAEYLGIKTKFCQRIDNLCNSGTNAIISGYSHIKSGLCNTVLVIGADLESTKGRRLKWDISRGQFPFPVHWAALFAKAHMRKYGTTEEQMASVTVKNRKNAMNNPAAIFSSGVSIEEVLGSKKIADPIKLLDCSCICDGASALVMTNGDNACEFTDTPVWIKGIGAHTNSASFGGLGDDLTTVKSAKLAARQAYTMAKVRPKDIDIVELHDAFTIMEIMSYEDLDLTSKGHGGKFISQRHIHINPRGGLLGSGHPLGATGVAQTAEIFNQLVRKAGIRQIRDPCKLGLVHNLAAAGTSAAVLIMGI